APVRLVFNGAEITVKPKEIAGLLELPANGRTKLAIDRADARRLFENLARGVQRSPADADFAVRTDGKVRVVRSRAGRELDLAATSRALLTAATGTGPRRAEVAVVRVRPELTTAEARALRIERQLASYTTLYSGTADRIVNLQRAIALLDGALVAPGREFSFNGRVGPRTEERGFRPAPVIVDAEYEVDIGGGVSQVATTLFNAAWDAGLKITSRTAHALYIDRYPLGRDATVNYPDIDLRFRNDTRRWLVLDATYDESGISIGLLGAGRERRVVSQAGELEETGPPRIERKPDPTLYEGERVVEDYGEPSRAVRVARIVYVGDDELYRESWYTSYRGEPRIVRVGTKPRPEEPAPPKQEPKPKAGDEPTPGGQP
ncbi:MAG: VanW family protein, partial [Gaiellaceae bacterium]